MKITSNEQGYIELEEVFNPIKLVSEKGESILICMRDSGFEFIYGGKKYFAKEGIVGQTLKSKVLNYKDMEYELTKDCRFGKKGKRVSHSVYYHAFAEEKRTCFREIGATQSASLHSADSHNYVPNVTPGISPSLWSSDGSDTSSSVSSSSPIEDDSVRYGGGSFGGGGASGDYDNSDCASDDTTDYGGGD